MPTTLAARLAPTSGNKLSFGSDNGLFATVPGRPLGGTFGRVIDNSQGPAGQAWYYNTPGVTAAASLPATAAFWPLIVSRRAWLSGAVLNITTAGAAGSVVYNHLYGADPVTGLPGARLTTGSSWFQVNAQTVAFVSASPTTQGSPILDPFTLYWVLTWVNTAGAYPQVTCRTSTTNMANVLPRLTLPTSSTPYSNGYPALSETATSTWATLTAPPGSVAVGWNGTVSVVPYYWLEFVNV
jgi:hypothetical protein